MGPRRVRKIEGTPVSKAVCEELLQALELWAAQGHRERPTIKAQQYMILSGQ